MVMVDSFLGQVDGCKGKSAGECADERLNVNDCQVGQKTNVDLCIEA